VESVFVFVVTAIALFFLDGFWLAVTILGVCMGLVVLVLPFFWFHCIRRAKSEVHAILDNANRKARVNDAFRALPS
jgi:hypothetical protein